MVQKMSHSLLGANCMEIPNSREMLFDSLLMVKGENKIKNQSVPEHAVYFNSEPSMIFKKPEQTHAYSWWNLQRSKNSFQTTILMVKVFFPCCQPFLLKPCAKTLTILTIYNTGTPLSFKWNLCYRNWHEVAKLKVVQGLNKISLKPQPLRKAFSTIQTCICHLSWT